MSGLIGAIEALRCGTTTVIDHHASPNAILGSLDHLAHGIERIGLRAVLCYETTDRNGPVIGMMSVQDDDDVMLITSGGMIVRTAVGAISQIGRNTQGVRLIALSDGDTLVAMARVARDEDDEVAGPVGDEAVESAEPDSEA